MPSHLISSSGTGSIVPTDDGDSSETGSNVQTDDGDSDSSDDKVPPISTSKKTLAGSSRPLTEEQNEYF